MPQCLRGSFHGTFPLLIAALIIHCPAVLGKESFTAETGAVLRRAKLHEPPSATAVAISAGGDVEDLQQNIANQPQKKDTSLTTSTRMILKSAATHQCLHLHLSTFSLVTCDSEDKKQQFWKNGLTGSHHYQNVTSHEGKVLCNNADGKVMAADGSANGDCNPDFAKVDLVQMGDNGCYMVRFSKSLNTVVRQPAFGNSVHVCMGLPRDEAGIAIQSLTTTADLCSTIDAKKPEALWRFFPTDVSEDAEPC